MRQGEITPLEIRIHALNYGEKGTYGGGLEAYSKSLGKLRQFVAQLANAARVLKTQVNL